MPRLGSRVRISSPARIPKDLSATADESFFYSSNEKCSDGGIGRHAGLKILCSFGRAGSSPAPSTNEVEKPLEISEGFFRLDVLAVLLSLIIDGIPLFN